MGDVIEGVDFQNKTGSERGPETHHQVETEMQMSNLELDGGSRKWKVLKNGTRANVERITRESFVARFGFKVDEDDLTEGKKEGESVAQGTEPNAAVAGIEKQLKKGKVDGTVMAKLESVFMELQEDVCILDEHGLDSLKMGNRVDFDAKPHFIVSESLAPTVIAKLKEAKGGAGALPMSFDIEPRYNYLENEGFIAKFRHQDAEGKEVITEIRFLYSLDDSAEEKGDNLEEESAPPVFSKAEVKGKYELPEIEETVYDSLVVIFERHLNDKEATKKEILEKVSTGEIKLSDYFKNKVLPENKDSWLPTKEEVEDIERTRALSA